MENIKNTINALIQEGKYNDALVSINAYLAENQNSDEAWFLAGNVYRKMENWQGAMNAYIKAMDINPESPAKAAYGMIVSILDFYDKNRYNQ
ncbi:MAG: tetratricopeptide repeat protein [Bacteroidia bacterium]|nr:tetratricopeptide repeat protein [Bacteroidia bacterium]